MVLVTLALSIACGGDEDALFKPSIDAVDRFCTEKVYAHRPFGDAHLVDRYAIRFRVPEEAQSFMVMTHVSDRSTVIAALEAPSGRVYDLTVGDLLERYHPGGLSSLYGIPLDVDRILIPPTPDLGWIMEPGVWELRADTSASRLCARIAFTEQPGRRLDLTFWFVGLDGLDAASAPADADWREVTAELVRVYRAAGIGVNVEGAAYRDIGGLDAQRLSIVRDPDDFETLVSLSERTDHSFRLNVFLVRGFAGLFPPGVLGIASGIPGVAGVHGTSDSGIVFATEEYLGAPDVGGAPGNEVLGQVIAHEIGHFLGLFHTTELFGGTDPLDDTPTCPGVGVSSLEEARSCDDADNLMFPLALPGTAVELTDGQEATLVLNPLLRP